MSHLFSVTTLVLAVLILPSSNAGLRNGVNKQVSDATNIFSINLLKEVFDKDHGNVVISPVSLSTLLAIVHQAAASNTRKQLTQVLHAGPQALRAGYSNIILNIKNSGDNSTLEFANGAFLQEGLNVLEPFRRALLKDFLSEIQILDFSAPGKAADVINSWIEENTHGRITDLFNSDSLSVNTKLVLTNAIYFKSIWKIPFLEEFTRQKPFYTQDGAEVQVQTMNLDAALKEGFIENLQSRWIEIPYEGNKYSMLIIMPTRKITFDEMVQKFTTQHLTTIMDDINTAYAADVLLSLPKFKVATDINFVSTLKKLGLTDLFTMKSDLPRITGHPLYVDQVVQKAVIEINEKGTIGSAGSGIGVVAISAPASFEVNRPFLFFVIDNINTIPLFAGKVTDPSQ